VWRGTSPSSSLSDLLGYCVTVGRQLPEMVGRTHSCDAFSGASAICLRARPKSDRLLVVYLVGKRIFTSAGSLTATAGILTTSAFAAIIFSRVFNRRTRSFARGPSKGRTK
jgi:hypothetical protein